MEKWLPDEQTYFQEHIQQLVNAIHTVAPPVAERPNSESTAANPGSCDLERPNFSVLLDIFQD